MHSVYDICRSVPEYLVTSNESVHVMNCLLVNVKLSFAKNALETKGIFFESLVLLTFDILY